MVQPIIQVGMIHAGQAVTVVPGPPPARSTATGAYAAQMPRSAHPGQGGDHMRDARLDAGDAAGLGGLLPFFSNWLARGLERSARCWKSSPATPPCKTKPNAVSRKPPGPGSSSPPARGLAMTLRIRSAARPVLPSQTRGRHRVPRGLSALQEVI